MLRKFCFRRCLSLSRVHGHINTLIPKDKDIVHFFILVPRYTYRYKFFWESTTWTNLYADFCFIISLQNMASTVQLSNKRKHLKIVLVRTHLKIVLVRTQPKIGQEIPIAHHNRYSIKLSWIGFQTKLQLVISVHLVLVTHRGFNYSSPVLLI